MSHNTVTEWSHHVMVTITRSCDEEKVIEAFETDNII